MFYILEEPFIKEFYALFGADTIVPPPDICRTPPDHPYGNANLKSGTGVYYQ